jgi:hypothetical protein
MLVAVAVVFILVEIMGPVKQRVLAVQAEGVQEVGEQPVQLEQTEQAVVAVVALITEAVLAIVLEELAVLVLLLYGTWQVLHRQQVEPLQPMVLVLVNIMYTLLLILLTP